MNPSTAGEAVKLVKEVSKGIRGQKGVDIVLAPPFIYLASAKQAVSASSVKLAAQDSFWEGGGAYTGEISPKQLKSLGVQFVILGHSERRVMGETNAEIQKKLKAVLGAGMKAILCVGEREKKHDEALPLVIKEELRDSLSKIKKSLFGNLILAYEPVWAIGTGGADTPKNVFEISVLLRRELYRMAGKKLAFRIPIIYGGSVDDKNAKDFVSLGNVDGLLVGGASLNAKKFVNIVKSVSDI